MNQGPRPKTEPLLERIMVTGIFVHVRGVAGLPPAAVACLCAEYRADIGGDWNILLRALVGFRLLLPAS